MQVEALTFLNSSTKALWPVAPSTGVCETTNDELLHARTWERAAAGPATRPVATTVARAMSTPMRSSILVIALSFCEPMVEGRF